LGGCKDVSRCVYGQTPRVDSEREGEEAMRMGECGVGLPTHGTL